MSEIILTDNNDKNLEKIEVELSNIAKKDKQNWSNFYVLLKEVETKKLWEGNFNSFTAWVKHFALQSGMKESIIWNRKRAGEVYERYANIKIKENKNKKIEERSEIAPVQEVDLAQDTLILIDKIAKSNLEMEQELIDKAISGELRPKDLRNTYYTLRATDKRYLTENNSFNKHITKAQRESMNKQNTDAVLSAVDIVNYLKNANWLDEYNERKKEKDNSVKSGHERFKKFYEKEKYHTLTEFPVYTGTSKHSRRIDVLAIENITTVHSWDIALHGIEIKVSKADLVNDHKYTEYMDFVNYMWLAVPINLVGTAFETKHPDVGIIAFDTENNIVKIIDDAVDLRATKRNKTLETLVLKLI